MSIAARALPDRDRNFIDQKITSITVGVTRLAERYRTRKKDVLSGDDVQLAKMVNEEVDSAVRAVMSLGIFIERPESKNDTWGTTLESVVMLTTLWSEIKKSSFVDPHVLEEILVALYNIKNVVVQRISRGMWV